MSGLSSPLTDAAAAVRPEPLGRHDRDARREAVLAVDPLYRHCLLAAFALAAAAGGGFGLLAVHGGWLACSLWSVMVAGLAVRAVVPRAAVGRGMPDPAMLRRALALLAGSALAVAGLSAFAGGGDEAATVVAVVSAGAALAWLAGWRQRLVSALAQFTFLGLGGVLAVLITAPGGDIAALAATAVGGMAVVVVAIVTARGSDGFVNPLLVVTRIATVGWAAAAWGGGFVDGLGITLFVLVAVAVIALDAFLVWNRYFLAVVIAVATVHLLALPDLDVLHEALWLQLASVAAEFVLLLMAGIGHAEAVRRGLPTATYRIAPLCIVPRLDRAWDYPVKINVA